MVRQQHTNALSCYRMGPGVDFPVESESVVLTRIKLANTTWIFPGSQSISMMQALDFF